MKAPIKNSPAMLTVIGRVFQHYETAGYQPPNENPADVNMVVLVWRLGRIPGSVNPQERAAAVLSVAAWTFDWLQALHLNQTDIAQRIADERIRQQELFAQRRHAYRVDDPAIDWPRKLRVLVEEVGEVANAIDQWEANPRSKQAKAHFITELVQVAAVCVAWLESLEVNCTICGYHPSNGHHPFAPCTQEAK